MIDAMPAMQYRNRAAKAVAIGLMLAALTTGCAQTSAARGPSASPGPTSRLSPAQATEAFGLSLMRRLPAGNLVFSPDSVAAALAMTGTGAAGQTATQIARALQLSSPASFAAVGSLQGAIAAEQSTLAQGSSEAPTLNIANGLFVQQGFALQAPFTTGLAQSFGTSPQIVDFTSPSAPEAINTWIAKQTHGLIPRVVGKLLPTTRLALANAIYLKAAWSDKFKTRDTALEPFHGQDATTSTPFMHEAESFPYARGREYAALSLPYRNSTLSLVVVLPVGESLGKFEQHLDARALERIVHSLRRRSVRVSLPRFHLKTTATLNAPLQQLGIVDAFAEGKADFSRITQAVPLRISEVLHAADFKVDERGTEAAAATVVTVEALSEGIFPHAVSFNADRPFMFFLRDDRSGALLFAGRLVKPQD
jgi:serpin B